MKLEQCGNCRFWIKRSDEAADAGGGYCRRFPPNFPSNLKGRLYGNGEIGLHPDSGFLNDAWPNTHQQSWCGEWQAALSSPKPEQETP